MPLVIGGIVFLALTVYGVGAGADFGAGIVELTLRGPRASVQREVIHRAIGPIWEANHVWLILVIVVLFIAFPVSYSAIATALHLPLAAMLIGICLRGASFVFRHYLPDPAEGHGDAPLWRGVFAVSSLLTPMALGTCIGAIASGRIRVDVETGTVGSDFVTPWLAPFPIAVGALTTATFALLASVFLTCESDDPTCREGFRRRGLAAGVFVFLLAFLALGLASGGAPVVFEGLTGRWWSLPFHLATGATGVGTLACLAFHRFFEARVLVVLQTALMLNGWGLAQYPHLIVPDVTIENAAAPESLLTLLASVIGTGAVLLVPAYVGLYYVFKGERIFWLVKPSIEAKKPDSAP